MATPINNHKGIITITKLSEFDGLIHGYSTRKFGSMRPKHAGSGTALKKFAHALHIDPQKIVHMNQVHGNQVAWVTSADAGQTIKTTDALLTQDRDTFLGVITADCVPILVYDPKLHITGVIHAGWRGLFNEIIKATVIQMTERGSNAHDIIAAIGPCIRVCCYTISKDLADKFDKKFKERFTSAYLVHKNNAFYLDLPVLAKFQLQEIGLNIDKQLFSDTIVDTGICTFEDKDLYSYRKEGDDMGEFIGLIGRK